MIRLLELLIKFLAAFMEALAKIKARYEKVQERTRRGEDTEPRH